MSKHKLIILFILCIISTVGCSIKTDSEEEISSENVESNVDKLIELGILDSNAKLVNTVEEIDGDKNIKYEIYDTGENNLIAVCKIDKDHIEVYNKVELLNIVIYDKNKEFSGKHYIYADGSKSEHNMYIMKTSEKYSLN